VEEKPAGAAAVLLQRAQRSGGPYVPRRSDTWRITWTASFRVRQLRVAVLVYFRNCCSISQCGTIKNMVWRAQWDSVRKVPQRLYIFNFNVGL